jgi:hypothetical protein
VDICPPLGADQLAPRRQGRLTLKEEAWSKRERDSWMPWQRIKSASGSLRGVVSSFFGAKESVVVDLDADKVCGDSVRFCYCCSDTKNIQGFVDFVRFFV